MAYARRMLSSRMAVVTALAGLVLLVPVSGSVAADERSLIPLPPEIQTRLLAEMRGHMDTLDDVLLAVAEGDFAKAAEIAELRMDFGHNLWQRMAETGMSAEEIRARKEAMAAQGMGQGHGYGRGMGRGMGQGHGYGRGMGQGQGQGQGLGRFMPEDFRAFGQSFHQAAQDFATAARAVSSPATPEDYQSVVTALEGITAVCRGCHATYRVR